MNIFNLDLGFAGLLVASTRISIKLVISSDELSTVIFFLTSTTYIALSYVLHSTTVHSPFVRYHMRACSKIVLRPDEDRVLVSEMLSKSFWVIIVQLYCHFAHSVGYG